jgi:hypothetical protein
MARTFDSIPPENALAKAREYVSEITEAIYERHILLERLKRGDNSEAIRDAEEELALLRDALTLAREYLRPLQKQG